MTVSERRPDAALSSAKLRHVSDRFAGRQELPWMLASGAIIQAHKIISSRVTAVLGEIEDLSMTRYEILGLLDRAEGGELTVRDLKRASFMHPPTLTYILDWLEGRELVTRTVHSGDRRSVLVHITDKGRSLFRTASTALGEIHFGLLGLDAREAGAVAHALGQVQSA